MLHSSVLMSFDAGLTILSFGTRQGSPAVVLTPQWLLDAMAQAPVEQLVAHPT